MKIINNKKFVFNTILINTVPDYRYVYNEHRENKIKGKVPSIIITVIILYRVYYIVVVIT